MAQDPSNGAVEFGIVKLKQVRRSIEKKIAHPKIEADLQCNKASDSKGFGRGTALAKW